MPSLSLADLLARIFRLAKSGHQQEAYEVFTGTLPQIVFSLQNMELYHHAEKRLLAARGIIREAFVRDLRRDLTPLDAAHIDFLNANILALLDRLKMPRCPISREAVEAAQRLAERAHNAWPQHAKPGNPDRGMGRFKSFRSAQLLIKDRHV